MNLSIYEHAVRRVKLIRANVPGPVYELTVFHVMIGYNTLMAQSFSAKIANIVLPEATGGEVRLGSLWEKSRAVVVFLRHYG